MTKILYVVGQLAPDGTEWQLVTLLRGLNKQRFRCYVCSLWPILDLAGEVRRAGADLVPIHKRARLDVSVLVRLARFIREERVDIVHCMLPTANLWGRFAALLAGAKVIVSERNVESWKRWYWLCLDRELGRFTEVVLTNAEAIKTFVVASAGIPPGRVRVIYNAVDAERFPGVDPGPLRQELGIPASAKVVTSIGRLEAQKDMGTYLRACAQVRCLVDRWDLRVLVVGIGAERATLEGLAAELGIAQETLFLGWRPDIEAILALTDVFVLTSVREGLPNVVLEAMAAGTPVVASAVGGTPEAVVDGITGFLVQPGDTAGFAQAIHRLLSEPRLAAEMGERGRVRAVEMFSEPRMVRETEQVYLQLCPPT